MGPTFADVERSLRVFSLERNFTLPALKAQRRRLLRVHHPDLVLAPESAKRLATKRTAQINAAYQILVHFKRDEQKPPADQAHSSNEFIRGIHSAAREWIRINQHVTSLVVTAATCLALGALLGGAKGSPTTVPGVTKFTLGSFPSGAFVYDEERKPLGRTPLTLEVPRSTRQYEYLIQTPVSRDGKWVHLDASQDKREYVIFDKSRRHYSSLRDKSPYPLPCDRLVLSVHASNSAQVSIDGRNINTARALKSGQIILKSKGGEYFAVLYDLYKGLILDINGPRGGFLMSREGRHSFPAYTSLDGRRKLFRLFGEKDGDFDVQLALGCADDLLQGAK